MDDPEAVGRGSGPEVVLVEDCDGQPTETPVPRDTGAVNACTYDEEIKRGVD
jgi:hypothetical protein